MLFNSYIFILLFLPLSLFLYFGLLRLGKDNLAKVSLIGMSLWFYAYFNISYLFIIVASILFNNFLSGQLSSARWSKNVRKIMLWFGIAINVGIIFYYKYLDFCIENINVLFQKDYALQNILMPLGISFFTFQQISYLVDAYRGETAGYSFIEYALFVTFFPQLVAGPIVLHQEIIPQFNDPERKKINQERFARGIYLFAIGLFKKVMIADTLAKGADWGFANPEVLTGFETLIVILLFTLQLYFDFSGYCDMASGIASMFQIELPINFNSPYKATSISEFWDRWHMSLSRFLRKYIYFPLGGSRKGKLRTLLNIMIVFLVSGIWHGAAWTYIVWGVLHGIARVLHYLFKNIWEKIPRLIRWGMTFLFVNLAFMIFRAASMAEAMIMLRNLINPGGLELQSGLLSQFDLLEFTYIEDHIGVLGNVIGRFPWLHLGLVLAVALFIALIPRNSQERKFVSSIPQACFCIILLVWSIMSLSGLSTFLYFNF